MVTGEPVGRPADGHSARPGPERVAIGVEIVRAMLRHARAEYPNEACGLVIGSGPPAEGGRALRFEAARNAAASPYRYELDPNDLLRLTVAADDADEEFWAIVHSHVRTAARPSPTDIGLALYPDSLYVLVALAEAPDDEAVVTSGASVSPFVRAWRILDGHVWEVALDVVA